jgi:hypothetical protein
MKPSDTLARLRARSVEAGRFVLATDPQWAEKLGAAYRKVHTLGPEGGGDETLTDQLAQAKNELAALEASAGDNVVIFRFRRMGKPEYEELLARHPATAEQRKVQDENNVPPYMRKVWNEETFEPDLVQRVLIEPKLSLEEVCEMLRPDVTAEPILSMGEARDLVQAAMSAAMSLPPAIPEELRLP